MPSAPKAIYWDSACFLSYVNEDAPRMVALDALIEASGRGKIHLFTSELSQVEVAFGASEQRQHELDPNIELRLDALWADAKVVTVIEYHNRIGRIARSMIRDTIARGQRTLKPIDAIHLATARWLRSEGGVVDEFHTYDQDLFKYADICGFRILEPYVEQPNLI